MSAQHATTIIDAYLARLDLALTGADPLRRRELMEESPMHVSDWRTRRTPLFSPPANVSANRRTSLARSGR